MHRSARAVGFPDAGPNAVPGRSGDGALASSRERDTPDLHTVRWHAKLGTVLERLEAAWRSPVAVLVQSVLAFDLIGCRISLKPDRNGRARWSVAHSEAAAEGSCVAARLWSCTSCSNQVCQRDEWGTEKMNLGGGLSQSRHSRSTL